MIRQTFRLPSLGLLTLIRFGYICRVKSQSYFRTGALKPTTSNFIFQLNSCGYTPYVTSSMTKGLVCCVQLLLVLASAVVLRSESCGTDDHILLSQIRDSPNLEGQVPRNRVAQLCPLALGSRFVASCDSQRYGGGNRKHWYTYTRRSGNWQWAGGGTVIGRTEKPGAIR
jgi:hypothetical protein